MSEKKNILVCFNPSQFKTLSINNDAIVETLNEEPVAA